MEKDDQHVPLRDVQMAVYFLVLTECEETRLRYQEMKDHEEESVARGRRQDIVRKATADVLFWQRRLDVLELRAKACRTALGIVE